MITAARWCHDAHVRLQLSAPPLLLLVACASPTVQDTPFPDASVRGDARAPDATEGDAAARDAEPNDGAVDAGADLDAAAGPDALPGADRPAGMSRPPTPRQAHSATVLADGRVLVVGGIGSSPTQGESYIYDPATDFWIAGPAVNPPRGAAPALLLDDGRVLIAGGARYQGTRTATTHRSSLLFDPRTLELRATGDLNQARAGATAHVIKGGPDRGKVMVLGGYVGTNGRVRTVEVYDPATETFTLVPGVTWPEYWTGGTTAQLTDGRVLLVGGVATTPGEPALAAAHLYDPSARTLRTLTSTPALLDATGSLTTLPDGRVLLLGGRDASTDTETTVQYFDPATERFTFGPPLPAKRWVPATVLLPDGRFLVIGGSDRAPTDTIYALDLNAGWSLLPARLSRPLSLAEAVYVGGPVLVIGGQTTTGLVLGTAELFQP